MNSYYVYVYKNPLKDNIPFYIGKGKDNRMFDHLLETIDTTSNRRKYYTIQSIRNAGLEPVIEKIEENLSESSAYELEESLIEKYGRAGYDVGGILTNVCKNNQPPSPKGKTKSAEHRKKLSESHKGKIVSNETKEKISRITAERIRNGEFGHNTPHTEQTKQKISNSKKGYIPSDEDRKKKSKALKGKPWSEARRLAAKNGKKTGPKKGKPWSEARRLAQLNKQEKNND